MASSTEKIPVILQARVGSKRYPGKMLEDISGRTLLERVLIRIESATGSPEVLAIPDGDANEPLCRIALGRGWRVFRGSEDDVLGRFARSLEALGASRFLRATGDNPLIEPLAIRSVIGALAGDRFSVARTIGYPLGAGAEGARAAALFAADKEARDPYSREHVMPYLYANPARFSVESIAAPPEWSKACRVTVDTAEDIERMRGVFRRFGDHPGLSEVMEFLGA